MSSSLLPSASLTRVACTSTSNDSGCTRRVVMRSTSTAEQAPIATISSSTGVKSSVSPLPTLIVFPRELVAA